MQLGFGIGVIFEDVEVILSGCYTRAHNQVAYRRAWQGLIFEGYLEYVGSLIEA